MRSPVTWFVLLTGCCIAGPYLLGVPPTTRRHWLFLTIAIAFIAWVLLPLATGLRSR